MLRYIITILLLLLNIPSFSDNTVKETKTLIVGATHYPPFVIIDGNHFHGINVDIWRNVATHLNYKFKLIELGQNIDENVIALSQNKFDILLGPATMSYKRSRLVDFTRPYAINQTGLVVPVEHRSLYTAFAIIVKDFLSITVITALFLLFIYSNLVWYFERKNIPDLPPTYISAINHIMWATILGSRIITLPKTYGGRFVQFVWVTVSTAVLSVIYATVITVIHKYYSSNDFVLNESAKVSALYGGVGALYADRDGYMITYVKSRKDGINLVLDKTTKAYADYNESSRYYIMKHDLSEQLQISTQILNTNTLGIGLPRHSKIIHDIDTELSYMIDNGTIQKICTKYLGISSAKKVCF